MEELCKSIKEKFPECIPLGCDSEGQLFAILCEQLGYDYTSIDPTNHYLFNNDKAKEIVTMLKRWYDAGYFITKETYGNPQYISTPFCNQEIYMAICSSSSAAYVTCDSFTTGVTKLPGGLGVPDGRYQRDSYLQLVSTCFFSSATAAQQKAAWLFYKFITTPENSAKWSTNSTYCPVRMSSFTNSIFLDYLNDTTDASKYLIRATKSLFQSTVSSLAVFPSFGNASTVITETGNIIVNVLKGTKTLEDAFNDAITNCNA